MAKVQIKSEKNLLLSNKNPILWDKFSFGQTNDLLSSHKILDKSRTFLEEP